MRITRLVRRRSAAIFSAVLAAGMPLTAHATDYYWNTAGNGTWSDNTKWSDAPTGGASGVSFPTLLDTATFNQTGINGAETISLGGDRGAFGITFTNTGTTAIQGGGTNQILTIDAGGLTVNTGAGAVTLGSATAGQQVAVLLNSAQTWTNNSTAALTVTNGVTLANAGTQTLTIGGTGNTTLSGVLGNGAGTLGLAKTGAGSLTLGGTNTFTGPISITGGGTLVVTTDANLGAVPAAPTSGLITIDNGTLAGGGLAALAGGLNVNRGIAVGTGGATFLNNTAAEFRIHSMITGGTTGLVTFNVTGAGNLVPDNGTNTQASTSPNTYAGGTLIIGAGTGAVIPIQSSTGAPDAPTAGPFGTGTITFGGGNFRATSVGAVTLHNTIQISADTAFLNGGAALNFLGSVTLLNGTRTISSISANPVTYSGVIGDAGNNYGITKAGTGTVVLGAANTFGGPVTVTGGVLSVTSLTTGGSPSPLGQAPGTPANLILNGGLLGYSGTTAATLNRGWTFGTTGAGFDASGTVAAATLTVSTAPTFTGTVAGARTLSLGGTNSGVNTFSFAIADNTATDITAVNKIGAGSWTYTVPNTYTGTTTVTAGALNLGVTNALANSPVVLTGGTLNLGAAGALGSAPSVTFNGGAIANTTGTPFTTGVAFAVTGNIGFGNTGDTSANNITFSTTTPIASTIVRTVTLNGASAVFTIAAPWNNSNDANSTLTVNGTGSTLRLGGIAIAPLATNRTVTLAGTGNLNITGNITDGGTATASALSITSTGTVTLGGASTHNGTLTVNNTTGTAIISGTKTGTGAVTVTSGTLNAANSLAYTGVTTINGGTLNLTGGGGLGNTAVTVNAGTLGVLQAASATSNALAGTLTLNSASTLTMVDGFTTTLTAGSTATLAPASGTSPVLRFELAAANGVSDKLAITGTASSGVSGARIALSALGTLTPGNSYTVLTGGSGSSLTTNAPTLASRKVFSPATNSYYLATLTNTATTSVVTIGATGLDAAYWTGSRSNVWNTVNPGPQTNWATDSTGSTDTGAIPSAVTDVFFSASGASNLSNTLGADTAVNSITFTATSGAVTIGGGNTLTLSGGITVPTGAAAHTINAPIALANTQTWTNSSTNTFTAGAISTGDYDLTLAGTGAYALTGVVSGTGSLTKSTTGTVTLTAPNTYTGTTIITNGTLVLSGGNNRLLSTGNVTFGAPAQTLNLAGAISQTVGNLTFDNTTTNTSTISGSTATLVSNATADFTIGANISGGTRTVSMSGLGAFTFNGPGNAFNVGGVYNVSGGSTSTGILNLAPTSSITALSFNVAHFTNGQTYQNSGTVSLGQSTTINASTIIVGAGKTIGTLNFQTLTSPSLTIRGTAGGSSAANLTVGTGNSGSVATTGLVDLTSNVTGASVLDAEVGTLTIATNATLSNTTGTFRMAAGTLDAGTIILGQTSGTTTGAVINGTFSLSGGTVNAGTTTLANFGGTGTGATSAATFTINSGTFNVATLQRGVSTGVAGNINFSWVDGTIGNIPGLNQTVDGKTAVSGTTGGLTIAMATTGANSHTWNVTASNTATVNNFTILSGANANLTKTGAGTLVLGGANTYTGTTTVSAGQLTVSGTGTLAAASSLNVGAAGQFNYNPTTLGALNVANLTLAAGATIGTTWNATTSSSINATAAASVPASGMIYLAPSGTFTSGTQYTLLSSTAGSGFNAGASYFVMNQTNFTAAVQVNPGSVVVTPTTATALTGAFWQGGLVSGTGNGTVWAISDGTTSNWVTSAAGGATPLVPGGAAVPVTFSATAAAASDQIGMTLGADMTIGTLALNSSNPISTVADGHTLTLGAAGGITVGSGAGTVTLGNAFLLGIAQTWTNSNTANPFNVTGAINTNGFVVTLTGPASTNTNVSGLIGGTGGVTKAGLGAVTLSGTNTYTGSTTIDQGTLKFAANQTLAGGLTFGSANTVTTTGTLDLSTASATVNGAFNSQTNSSTANTITIGAGQTLATNGNVTIGPGGTATNNALTVSGPGAWTITGAAVNVTVGGSSTGLSTTTVNMNGATPLSTFTANLGTGTFKIGSTETGSNPADVLLVRLATTSTITAATLDIGGSASHAGTSTLQIGAGAGASRSVINADTINIGSRTTATTALRGNGKIEFASAAGELKIRAANGTGAAAVNLINSTANTNSTLTADLLLSGHTADVSIGTLTMASRTPAATWTTVANTSSLTFSAGTFAATSMIMSNRGGASVTTGTTSASATFSGGTVSLGAVTMSQNAATTATSSGNASATLTFDGAGGNNTLTSLAMGNNTVTGATATSGTSATLTHNGSSVPATLTTTTIGTLTMAVNAAGSAVTGATTATSTINLGGGTLNVTSLNRGNTTTNALNVITNTINITGGTLNLGNNLVYTNGVGTENTTLTLNGGTLDMGGFSIGSATALVGSGSGALNMQSGKLQNVAQINNGAGWTKSTAGSLELAGVNAYTGTTAINAGSLYVNGTHNPASATSNSYTITGSGTTPSLLGGVGAITLKTATDAVTASGVAAANGIIGPGNIAGAVGTLTVAGSGTGVVFGANSRLVIDTGPGNTSDLLNITGGNLDLSGTTDTLAVTAPALSGPYTIVQFAGTVSGTFDTVILNGVTETGSTVPATDPFGFNAGSGMLFTATSGNIFVFYNDTAKNVQVAVPEPTSIGLLAVGALGLLGRRRHRHA